MRLAILSLAIAFSVLSISPSKAQERATIPRIGVLAGASTSAHIPTLQGLWDGLRALGYVEGKDFRIEFRSAEGRNERLPALAAELAALKPDVIVASTTPTILALKNATRTIPVVLVTVSDPVGLGVVETLAHPGGNFTGLTDNANEMIAKQVQVLKELLPEATEIVAIWNPTSSNNADQFALAQRAAAGMGVHVRSLPVRGPEELQQALETPISRGVGGMLVIADALLYRYRRSIIEFATEHRLPALWPFSDAVAEGALMAYGPNYVDIFRRAATYVDKVLKGAKPAEMPVEEPTTFGLVINLRTAATLDLTIPGSLLARADKLIE
jgi:putative ABC transport system substrate-binding protein